MKNRNEDPSTHQRAKELQMDACLTELGGARPDRSLANRILDEVGERDPKGSVTTTSAPAPRWLLAAIVVVGLSVVGGIAYMRMEQDIDKNTANSGSHEPSDLTPPNPTAQGPAVQDPADGTETPKLVTTLICDYTDNCILEVDSEGETIQRWTELFGVWDASLLPNGNLLLVEFSTSRVSERTRGGEVVWSFEDLKNPYSAQRLQNGNTLIANTFAGEVLEITPKGEIAWRYADETRPFDAEITAVGTILIADVLEDRVIEVNRDKQIVWEAKNLPNAHDADRLPNGNTLVTLRNKGTVVELDPDGKVVWELTGLSSPSDADRLPNGNTLIAENTQVREFRKDKKVVWRKQMSWAVEANRYVR